MNDALFTIFVQSLVPISVCVLLPVLVIWLWTRMKTNNNNKRSEVLLEAIRNNNNIDANKLAEVLEQDKKTALEILHSRLLYGCRYSFIGIAMLICSYVSQLKDSDRDIWYNLLVVGCIVLAIGISFLVVYFVTRKTVEEASKQQKEKE